LKIKIFINSILFTALFIISCSKSTEEEFIEANGNVAEKYITRFQIIDDNGENTTYIINYGEGNKVSSVTDGNSTAFLNYNASDDLSTVTDENETFDIDDLYQAPYDAFEKGNVLDYDDKGNPIKIEVYEDGPGSEVFIGTIIYDPNPNSFFYTLKAAGVIDVLDSVDLDFGIGSAIIIKARRLFPNNNIRTMIFKDQAGITRQEVQIGYNYDEDGYPASAVVNAFSLDETSSHTLIYTYK